VGRVAGERRRRDADDAGLQRAPPGRHRAPFLRNAALRPLTTDFHEPGFAATLAGEDAFTQAKGFRFQLRDEDRRQGAGAQWQWGPANPQALNRYAYVLDNPLRYTDPTGHFIIAIPAAVAALFTAEVLADVVALFVVYSFVTAVITCSQDPGCSSVLGRFADQLNQGAITVQEFLGKVQRSLAQGQNGQSGRNPAQDKKLSNGEIDLLQEGGIDIHELKGGKNASKYDLYKDRQGNIYIKRKGDSGEGEDTGLNINDFK